MFRRLGLIRFVLLLALAVAIALTTVAGTTGITGTTTEPGAGSGVTSRSRWVLETSPLSMAVMLVVELALVGVVFRSARRP